MFGYILLKKLLFFRKLKMFSVFVFLNMFLGFLAWKYLVQSQSGPESDDNEGLICILQTSSITGVSSSDGLVFYQDI